MYEGNIDLGRLPLKKSSDRDLHCSFCLSTVHICEGNVDPDRLILKKPADLDLHCVFWLSTVFFDLLLTAKAAPHECAIRTGQP